MLALDEVVARVRGLQQRNNARDARHAAVLAVRRGEAETLMPNAFSEEWPKPIVANTIDTGARDLSEVTGAAPSINCSTTKQTSDEARKRADKRTRIANWYAEASHLEANLPLAADYYYTLGMSAFRVEPCEDNGLERPHISVEDTRGAYAEFDRWGNCTGYAKKYLMSAPQISATFPEAESWLRGMRGEQGGFVIADKYTEAQVEVWRYDDKDQSVMYAYRPTGNQKFLQLAHWDNPLGKCLVVPVRRPSVDDEQRGQFDDAIYIFLAQARYASLALKAAKQATDAPLAVPQDITSLNLGANAVIRSREPEKIRRIGADIPAGAFVPAELLEQQLRHAIRYPESRTGNMDASVITGRGVQALEGGFDTQIKVAQLYHARGITTAIELAFELDETLWPDTERSIKGMESGSPFEMTYKPSKDINGDYTVDVSYGLLGGMDPNRSLIWILQALQAGLISEDTARRHLPTSMNVTEEERQVDIEKSRDALMQGIAAMAQSIPAMAQQGMDPSETVTKIAMVIDMRRKGKSIEDAVAKAFAPTPPPEPQPSGSEQANPSAAPGEQATGGGQALGPDGLPDGVAQGQAGMAPGGRPDLSYMLAGIGANGSANLTSNVVKRVPAR